jgi:peptidoglycan/xylan/chitin deacetylase (PgdA/CDA1 family)
MSELVGSSVVALQPPATSVVLTYDDGPTPGVTDLLLPELAEAGATATFFVLLTRVRSHPRLMREVQAAGHEIGLHGPDHRVLTSLAPDTLPRRFRDAKAELEDLAGVPVRWSRPPYGAQQLAAWRAARDASLRPVLWSITCQDWETHPSERYLTELRATDPAGRVILLHDGFADERDGVDDGPAPDLDRIDLTRQVLDETGAAGLVVRSLGDALASAEPALRPWLDELGDPP